jgi:hypothetical protein
MVILAGTPALVRVAESKIAGHFTGTTETWLKLARLTLT